jgi:DNA-binding transcriptional LysR family regulator
MWWLQEYAFYKEVAFQPGEEIRLMPIVGEVPEAIVAENVEGIDADSSPLRFRACFTTPLTQAMLTETYRLYDRPEPTVGPSWFGCYDAEAIGEALEAGEALAFLSEPLASYGMDRVVAVFPDGRAFAWHQINACGKAHYERRDLPQGCPTPPEESN